MLARLGQAREFHLRVAGAQIVLRLHEFAGVDARERRALRDLVAQIGDHARDAPRVGRIHRRGAIPVDGDLALGALLADEGVAGRPPRPSGS